ncbi:MAG: hypothetical protein LBP86_11715 [Azoarcus sp.]|jgi:hypothetical protein|nr:hypothetical protein [Azoarcus sp.]
MNTATIMAWQEYCKALAPRLQTACRRLSFSAPAVDGLAAMVRAFENEEPEWPFHYRMRRGGWYRLGGVVDGAGIRVADNLEAWGEAALGAHGGDLDALLEELEETPLHATRFAGNTHYLVAPTGDGPANFLQLEIEELQEVRAHRLGKNAIAAAQGTLAELIDPPLPLARHEALGKRFFRFRRLAHAGSILERISAQKADAPPLQRFLDDWRESSAGAQSTFSTHWVVAFREYLDRYRQTRYSAQPIAVLSNSPAFGLAPGAGGLELHNALNAFDHSAGYPFAWFFHMLTTKTVPHRVAQTVVEDALNGFAYLPQRDVNVVRNWLHRPYAV